MILGEWTEETKETISTVPVIENGRVTGLKHQPLTIKQRVRYDQLSLPQKLSCTENDHYWHIPDKHTHIAHCKNCTKKQFIRAVYEKVVDGTIIPRD